jgi:hypothetical protein
VSASLLAAAVSTAALALMHSVGGEAMIFTHRHEFRGLPRFFGRDDLALPSIRVTWHVPSLLGAAITAIFARFASLDALDDSQRFVVHVLGVSLAVCGVLVLAGTRGRHPAWIGFFGVAAFAWAGTS